MAQTQKFYRFEMPTSDPKTGIRDGMFVEAYRAMRDVSGEIPSYHLKSLEIPINGFRKNLDEPSRFNSTTSKGAYRRSTNGISWFKDTATEHISKAREISIILEDIGHFVAQKSTNRPGYIIFEDEFQIVAEPFADR